MFTFRLNNINPYLNFFDFKDTPSIIMKTTTANLKATTRESYSFLKI